MDFSYYFCFSFYISTSVSSYHGIFRETKVAYLLHATLTGECNIYTYATLKKQKTKLDIFLSFIVYIPVSKVGQNQHIVQIKEFVEW